MQATWTEIDGVPTVSAAAGEIQGPLHAMLTFGSGRLDETIHDFRRRPRGRASRAARHRRCGLASPTAVSTSSPPRSGSRGALTTSSSSSRRSPGGCTRFRSIASRTSCACSRSKRSGTTSTRTSPRISCGASAHTAPGHRVPGVRLKKVTPERAQMWANTRFVAENAVLWFSGPVPAGARLDRVPRGPRPEPTPLPALRTDGRTVADIDSPHVSLSFLYSGWSGANAAVSLARERTHERLRRDALTYSVQHERFGVGADHALTFLQADTAKVEHARVARRGRRRGRRTHRRRAAARRAGEAPRVPRTLRWRSDLPPVATGDRRARTPLSTNASCSPPTSTTTSPDTPSNPCATTSACARLGNGDWPEGRRRRARRMGRCPLGRATGCSGPSSTRSPDGARVS